MPTVIIVRHGHSTSNGDGTLAGRTPGIHLSDKGRDGYARRTGARKPLDTAVVAAEVAESGGRILEQVREPVSTDAGSSQVCRMIIDFDA